MAPRSRRLREAPALPTPYVPVPSVLIDAVMPALSDTEWRVLCVVVRATLGWKDPEGGGRKARDWLSQAQLKRRTGRASEAVSRAVDGLVRRGLVAVTGAGGQALPTRALRRRWGGRLYYGLSPAALSPAQPGTSSDPELHKANTTKENSDGKQ